MAVTEIAIAGVAALVVVMAALVLVLSMSERGSHRASEPRRARRAPATLPPPPRPVPGRRAEPPGPFGPEKQGCAGPRGYRRPAGYRPPPLWDDARREQPPGWR
jgi:hypothetical protein